MFRDERLEESSDNSSGGKAEIENNTTANDRNLQVSIDRSNSNEARGAALENARASGRKRINGY
jgi:hypothetical protein